jgi:hypothetical protein
MDWNDFDQNAASNAHFSPDSGTPWSPCLEHYDMAYIVSRILALLCVLALPHDGPLEPGH